MTSYAQRPSIMIYVVVVLTLWPLVVFGADPPKNTELPNAPKYSDCLNFANVEALRARQALWRKTLEEHFRSDPKRFFKWVVGDTPPPEVVHTEARTQLSCLLVSLLAQKAIARLALIPLEFEKPLIYGIIKRAKRRKSVPRFVEWHIIRSGHRTSAEQWGMWRRRGEFDELSGLKIPKKLAVQCRAQSKRQRRLCRRDLRHTLKEKQISRGTAAPGLSRHHWGTDFDLFTVNSFEFRDKGELGPAYGWLKKNAHTFGFFQTFMGTAEIGYIAERWHWSYSPISQPLLSVIKANEALFLQNLEALWARITARWNRKLKRPKPYFSYIRSHWRAFAYNLGADWPPVEAAKSDVGTEGSQKTRGSK